MHPKIQWYACRFSYLPQAFDLMSYYLFELGAAGIEELEGRAIAYFSNQNISQLRTAMNLLFAKLKAAQVPLLNDKFEITPVPEEDWHAGWRKYFKPIDINEMICVRPPWERPAKKTEFEIIIEPKQAFGTGNHATTRLMLQAIVSHRDELPGLVLDVGTGSGILAVAHLLLQPQSRIFAVDIDEIAIENAREVALINQVAGRIDFHTGSFEVVPPAKYPLIYANLQRHIITPLLPQFRRFLSNDGKIFFSGILAEEAELMIAALREFDFRILQQKHMDEWILLQVVHDHTN